MNRRSRPDRTGDATIRLADGRRLGYREFGDPDGFPAFYFHGTPGSRVEGELVDPAARRHGFRIIAPDRPGFGLSTFQPGRRFTDWPADVLALAAELDLPRFGVLAHSGGGPHAFACGVAIPPARLAFIGALGPWGPIASPDVAARLNRLDRVMARLAQRAGWMLRIAFAPLGWCVRACPSLSVALLRASVSPPDRAALHGPLLDCLRRSELEAFRGGSRGGAHESLISYREWDLDPADIAVPTHIRLGDQDIFVPRQMGTFLQQAIPGVDLRWLPGQGHFAVESWDDILAACLAHR